LYSFVFVLAAALSLGAMNDDAVFGVSPESTPVQNPRRVRVNKLRLAQEEGTEYSLAAAARGVFDSNSASTVLLIDGNRDGRYVLFDHNMHEEKHEG
jgi:hypothetical protein